MFKAGDQVRYAGRLFLVVRYDGQTVSLRDDEGSTFNVSPGRVMYA